MRHLAIGDIHGCYTALQTVCEAAGLSSDDLLITVGDYVDRGPASREVLDWLIERHRQGGLIPLRGNHDELMVWSRDDVSHRDNWLQFGGQETLESYGTKAQPGTFADVPPEHWEFLEQTCRRYHELEHDILVHGNLVPELPLERQPDEILYWKRFHDVQPHCSGKRLICGHTAQKDGRPANRGFAVCIDTWVYGNGWLTCLDLETGEYWQANEQGASRSGFLPVASASQ